MSIVSNIEEQRIAVTNSYTVEQNLPVLTNPAAAGDVAQYKEYIDGSGEKRTGTMPDLDDEGIAISHDNGVIQAAVDGGVYTPSVITKTVQAAALEANLVTGNIKAGATVFGVNGKASIVDTQDANAAAGDTLVGKTVYVNGEKKTGTLVICDEVEGRTANGVSGVGLTVGIGSRKDSSQAELSIAQTSLAAENIKSGVSIFGINGSVREVTTASGTVTPAADTIPLLIPTPYENAKLLIVKVNNVADLETKTEKCFMRVTWQGADIDENFPIEAASFGYNTENPSNPYKGFTFAVNNIGSTVIMGIANWKFPAGVQYNWTAYYWD